MKKYLVVTADTNDADYITEVNEISDKDLKIIQPIIEAVKKCKCSTNWPSGECCTDESIEDLYPQFSDEEIEQFEEYIPRGEHGIHSIESIYIIEGQRKNIL